MADKDTVWTAVKSAYDSDGLISLTNVRDNAATTIDDTAGTSAADHALNLWPLYAEIDFDVLDLRHLAVAIRAVIAVLWERGGVGTAAGQQEWKEVFSDEDGLMSRLRRTESRGQGGPSTSGPDVTTTGREVRPWSARESMPVGYLPGVRRVNDR